MDFWSEDIADPGERGSLALYSALLSGGKSWACSWPSPAPIERQLSAEFDSSQKGIIAEPWNIGRFEIG